MGASTEIKGERLKGVRLMLGMGQEDFGMVFKSQKGDCLGQKAISDLERGETPITQERLEELLDFLDDPGPRLATMGHETNCALYHLAWYDPKAVDVAQAFSPTDPFGDLRAISGRRESLKPLILDIVALQESEGQWRARLQRCAREKLRDPLSEIRTLNVAPKGQPLDFNRHRDALVEDFSRHGPGLRYLFRSSHWETGDDASIIWTWQKNALDGLAAELSGITFGGLDFGKMLEGCEQQELKALCWGIGAACLKSDSERDLFRAAGDLLSALVTGGMWHRQHAARNRPKSRWGHTAAKETIEDLEVAENLFVFSGGYSPAGISFPFHGYIFRIQEFLTGGMTHGCDKRRTVVHPSRRWPRD